FVDGLQGFGFPPPCHPSYGVSGSYPRRDSHPLNTFALSGHTPRHARAVDGQIKFYDESTAWGIILGDDGGLYVVRGTLRSAPPCRSASASWAKTSWSSATGAGAWGCSSSTARTGAPRSSTGSWASAVSAAAITAGCTTWTAGFWKRRESRHRARSRTGSARA